MFNLVLICRGLGLIVILHKTSFNAGELVPVFCDEVLPGDTFDMKTNAVVRLSSPLKTPIMDDIYMDITFWFVPNRIIWDHWPEFMGENTQTKWYSQTEYVEPQVSAPDTTGWTHGTLADYFGIPTKISNFSVSALPFRAYCEIYNEWYRDENIIDPILFSTGDADIVGSNGDNYLSDTVKGGKPCHVARLRDYFQAVFLVLKNHLMYYYL